MHTVGAVVKYWHKYILCQHFCVILAVMEEYDMENIKEGADGRERSGRARMSKLTTEQRRNSANKQRQNDGLYRRSPSLGLTPPTPGAICQLPAT